MRHDPPDEIAEATDLWARMLRLTPPEHHLILLLKRDGVPLGEIATQTGLHVGSVRRILRRLSLELALREGSAPTPGVDDMGGEE
jgi:DNA-directed RNA polymerase specialized sigma24 family protein